MAGAQAARPARETVHRFTLGVPPADLDSGPVHLAAADHAHSLRASGNGLLKALQQRHRLSQYWVRPFLSLHLIFNIHFIDIVFSLIHFEYFPPQI